MVFDVVQRSNGLALTRGATHESVESAKWNRGADGCSACYAFNVPTSQLRLALDAFETDDLLRKIADMNGFARSTLSEIVLDIPNNTGTNYKKGNAKHDGHVGDVENARSEWTDADVQEIDHATMHYSIYEIRKPSGEQQPESKKSDAPQMARKRGDNTPNQERPGADREERRASPPGKPGSKTQKSAVILRVLKSERITKIGLARTVHEMCRRHVLRYLIAADSRRDNSEQDQLRAPSRHLSYS
jgi:hypothetical protein